MVSWVIVKIQENDKRLKDYSGEAIMNATMDL